MHPLMEKMSKGNIVVGMTLAELFRPAVVKLYANSGADFMFIEYEHSPIDPTAYADILLCAQDNSLPVVTKTPYLDRGSITKLLDAGAMALQLPMTESPEQVMTLHQWLKYPPVGIRAVTCGYGSTGYRDTDIGEFIEKQNEDTMLIAHIETLKGVDAVDDILGTGVVDLVFIGQADMSISVGAPGNYHDASHIAAVKRVAEAARKHDVFFGLFAPDTKSAERWVDEGALFFECTDEIMLIGEGARATVESFRRL